MERLFLNEMSIIIAMESNLLEFANRKGNTIDKTISNIKNRDIPQMRIISFFFAIEIK
jgi:hypothetical protein